ncbi:MAG: GNAT family N-acetyltransferase [Gammaproteobacteria bacterium]|nr:GNAT family N-acetyltransferase [Gammaproteobacteria bacterium]
MNTELRLAQTGDLNQLLPLVTAYHEFEHIESSAGERESALRQLVSEPTLGGIWLIYTEQALAGYIALCRGFSIEFNGFDAFVDEFYLSPQYRGQGIGREVLETVKGKAREMDIHALHLEVAHNNPRARKLYAAAGFDPRDQYLLMSAQLEE